MTAVFGRYQLSLMSPMSRLTASLSLRPLFLFPRRLSMRVLTAGRQRRVLRTQGQSGFQLFDPVDERCHKHIEPPASISGGTIIGLTVVDDIIIYVVTKNAVRVQISLFPGRPPPVAGRCPLTAACLPPPVGRTSLAAGCGPALAHRGTMTPLARSRIVDST